MVDADVAEEQMSAGKDYGGTSKFKAIKVEMQVSGVKMDEAKYYVAEITNQCADLVVTNANIGPSKISFDIGSPSMDDITAEDIEQRMKEFLMMNVPPFECKDLKVR